MSEPTCTLASWNWSEIIQTAASLLTLFIAYKALTIWRSQHKADKVTTLMDDLTDSIHDYLRSIGLPTQQLQLIQVNIENCRYEGGLNTELSHPEAIFFIENSGREESEKMLQALEGCSPSVTKIRSLVVKGQVLGIKNYQDCINACDLLTWQYDRLQAFCVMIGNPNYNWEHPKIIENLENILKITHEDIKAHLDENQGKYLNFVKDVYQNVYNNA